MTTRHTTSLQNSRPDNKTRKKKGSTLNDKHNCLPSSIPYQTPSRLELLQNYGRYLGLKPDPKLLTQVDAFVFLRGRLGELPLGSFEDLYHPTSQLCLLLKSISRAKDELVGPDEFERLVADWRARIAARPVPSDAEEAQHLASEQVENQRCSDVAAIYKIYQSLLREANYLDYGDLIAETVRIFEVAQVASEVRGHYDHILVDEFQDINYASGRLVWALDGGRGIVWAVGDPRQSIFRFRGASPINLRSFTEEYPNAQVITLETNYRSIDRRHR